MDERERWINSKWVDRWMDGLTHSQMDEQLQKHIFSGQQIMVWVLHPPGIN